eukprot:2146314-Prymnesium_polylepis.1
MPCITTRYATPCPPRRATALCHRTIPTQGPPLADGARSCARAVCRFARRGVCVADGVEGSRRRLDGVDGQGPKRARHAAGRPVPIMRRTRLCMGSCLGSRTPYVGSLGPRTPYVGSLVCGVTEKLSVGYLSCVFCVLDRA